MRTQDTTSPPPDVLVTGHFRVQQGYAAYRSHGSGNWLISYTLDGRGLYRQPGLDIWAEPGDIMLLQPGALHDYSVPPEGVWEFLWAHFQPRWEWLSWWRLPEVGQGLFKFHLHSPQTCERVRLAFLKLHMDACASQTIIPSSDAMLNASISTSSLPIGNGQDRLGAIQRDLALNGLEEVLLLAGREEAQTSDRVLDARVQCVLDLIGQDLARPYTLEALAKEVSLSPSRLSHLFKQEIGDSVVNFLLTMRLRKAVRLLEFTSHSVTMIAEEVGFLSSFYFSRQFHQRFGMSPRAYRAMLRGQQEQRE